MAVRAGLFAAAVCAAAVASAADVQPTKPSAEAGPEKPVFGGEPTEEAFKVWLSVWRNFYIHVSVNHSIPELKDADLPKAFRGISPKIVSSAGGAASGVVTEGMGYALMVEGMMAVRGDGWALKLGLGLARSWLGMVQGTSDVADHPLGGADTNDGSATKVDAGPYGVSAIRGAGGASAGMATWKFPRQLCMGPSGKNDACHGSATDGDEDALLGMMYLAAALGYPDDFVDLVMRGVIAFASADLGFPDLYRKLPDGRKVMLPKAGSQWGGLTPPNGKFKREKGVPDWCYAPGYFAPANYRMFRDFASGNWQPEFDKYLPPLLDGTPTQLKDLVASFDASILGGYNVLYYSSCESGSVSNWVGVQAACADDGALSCRGVPWTHTPYVGETGHCNVSGTHWGQYGADASRMPWRMAMDYVLFTEESEKVDMYDRTGHIDATIKFNARHYLHRFVTQYRRFAQCDGGIPGDCDCHYGDCKVNDTQAFPLSAAFEVNERTDEPPTHRAPGLVCDNVPNYGQTWWAGFMSWPTFTAFVVPYSEKVTYHEQTFGPMNRTESMTWMQTLTHLCDFSKFNDEGFWQINGAVCQMNYFHASQEVVSTMIMSGSVPALPKKGWRPPAVLREVLLESSKLAPTVTADENDRPGEEVNVKAERTRFRTAPASRHFPAAIAGGACAFAALAALVAGFWRRRRFCSPGTSRPEAPDPPEADDDARTYTSVAEGQTLLS